MTNNIYESLIALGIFIFIVLLVEGIMSASAASRSGEHKKVRSRLRTFSAEDYLDKSVDILKRRPLSNIPWLNNLLIKIPRAHAIDRTLEQADSNLPLGFFLLLTCLITAFGFLISEVMTRNFIVAGGVGIMLGFIPYVYILMMKSKRMKKFESQLPDALDLLGRSLRAGHAFASGLKMVADEFDDPIGIEFGKTFDEINFGVSVPDALKNLVTRVECTDLNFFAVSVIIQRDTGGNLAEILESIAYLIRERFKLNGKVRALSAEGRISGLVLFLLPVFFGMLIYMMRPNYIMVLFTDPLGRVFVAIGTVLMITGAFIMKHMIAIKV